MEFIIESIKNMKISDYNDESMNYLIESMTNLSLQHTITAEQKEVVINKINDTHLILCSKTRCVDKIQITNISFIY